MELFGKRPGLVMYGIQGLDAVAVVPAFVSPVVSGRTSLGINTGEGPGGEMSRQDPETKTKASTSDRRDRDQRFLKDRGVPGTCLEAVVIV